MGAGYLSRAVGGLLQLRIRRGELDAAAAGLARWKMRGLPEQFGLPMTVHTEMLLAEAQGRPGDVTETVLRSWTTALDSGRLLWALIAGPDVMRFAIAANDGTLLARVAGDTARVPTDEAMALAPTAWDRSMRITSAPMSESSMEAKGPGPMPASSTTR